MKILHLYSQKSEHLSAFIDDLSQKLFASDVVVEQMCLKKANGLKAIWDLSRKIKKEKIDCVHSHDRSSLIIGTLAARLAASLAISTVHQVYPKKVSSFIWNLNKNVVFATRYIKTRMLRRNRMAAHRISVIYRGIEIETNGVFDKNQERAQWGVNPESFIIGSAGPLEFNEDQTTLLKAFRKLRKKNLDSQLVFATKGSLKDHLKTKAKEFDVLDRVVFLDGKSDLNQFLQSIDLLVVSAIDGPRPEMLLQSMRAGTAVIATNIFGHDEYVEHNKTGYLVPCGYPEKIDTSIMRLNAIKTLPAQMGEAARERGQETFNLGHMSESYLKLYTQ